MLKSTTRESYCLTVIVFVLTRQETIKNNNTEQYLLFSNSGRFSWHEQNQDFSRRLTKFLVDHSLPHLLATFLVNCSFLCWTKRKICRYTCWTSDMRWREMRMWSFSYESVWFALCQVILIPESEKKIACGIRNPANDWNAWIQVPLTRNMNSRTWKPESTAWKDPRLSVISLHSVARTFLSREQKGKQRRLLFVP